MAFRREIWQDPGNPWFPKQIGKAHLVVDDLLVNLEYEL